VTPIVLERNISKTAVDVWLFVVHSFSLGTSGLSGDVWIIKQGRHTK